jgi:chromosome partitioning protein
MSTIITIINMKGGVGKTTLSVNLAYVLARFHGKKVLLVDIDPQFNATQYLVNQTTILSHFEKKKTIFDILQPKKEEEFSLSAKRAEKKTETVDLNDYIIPIVRMRQSTARLDLIPSSLKLINFEGKRGTEYLLKNFLNDKCKHYDIIIIDCPPTLSVLTLSAYLASQSYLIPIKPDYLSSLGLPLLERGLEEYRQTFAHSIDLLGITFTMKDNKSKDSDIVMKNIKDSGWDCFVAHSSHSIKVARSVKSLNKFYNQATFDKYASEFKNITKELISKI